MQNDSVPAYPNLDSLTRNQPTCKRALVRLLWPKIRASLDLGHTAREVRQKLQLDGIEVSYSSLCRYISELRRSEAGITTSATAAHGMRENGGRPKDLVAAVKRDPLENVRRLTEEKPPGFRYPGTLSDKELFGE
jgi:hypothetical protein